MMATREKVEAMAINMPKFCELLASFHVNIIFIKCEKTYHHDNVHRQGNTTHRQRRNLGHVSLRDSLHHADGDTGDDLASEVDGRGRGDEGDGDTSTGENNGTGHDLLAADLVLRPSGKERSDHHADVVAGVPGRLPVGGDREGAVDLLGKGHLEGRHGQAHGEHKIFISDETRTD